MEQLAFIVILIVIWLLRQLFGEKKSQEGSPSTLQKHLKKTFDEWSENIPSPEDFREARRAGPSGQPGVINCPNCGIRLELESADRQEKQFACPACHEWIDLRELGYLPKETTETTAERSGSTQRPHSLERQASEGTKDELNRFYGEELIESTQQPITEEKPVGEQRLEESQRPEQQPSAERAKPFAPLGGAGEDYYKPTRERRKGLEFLHRKKDIRSAFLIMELLQPPVSMRTSKSLWQDPED